MFIVNKGFFLNCILNFVKILCDWIFNIFYDNSKKYCIIEINVFIIENF